MVIHNEGTKDHLHFVRSRTAIQSESRYDSKTDVYMFGDTAGFSRFLDGLRSAERGEAVRLSPTGNRSTGMHALIMSANTARGVSPRIRFFERVIFVRKRARMEFVIYGNGSAYRRLADDIQKLLDRGGSPLLDHLHLDDESDRWILRRSIAVNIRMPLGAWSRSALGSYATAIYSENRFQLPDDIGYLSPWPYVLPDTRSADLRV